MAQRRNASSSGRGDGPSDLDDTKALAARARAHTGGPMLTPNPAELSGVRPRRDSVIGARLTPPPRTSGGEMPNWVWGVLGCLTVLLVGFVGIFVLARSGKLGSLLGEAAPVVATVGEPPPAAEPPPALAAAPAADEAPARAVRPPPAARPAEPAAPPAAAGEAPAEAKPSAATSRERASGKRITKPSEAVAPEALAEAEGAAEAKVAARPAKAPAAPAAEEEEDDDQAPPGQDAVEAALDALSTRVRGCFVKYQIKGTARVRLVATPAGTAESVYITGEFEDTPTGMCVESVISGAKLPSFKGPPLKLSQSYQLR